MSNYLDNLQFKIDWVQGVAKCTNFLKFVECLERNVSKEFKIDNWVYCGRGLRNYSKSFWFKGLPYIQIAYNPSFNDLFDSYRVPLQDFSSYTLTCGYNPYIFVSVSGQGLDLIRNISSIDKFFNALKFYNFSCSRIDIACDIFDSDNDLVPTILEAFDNDRQPIKGRPIIKSKMKRDWNFGGTCRSWNNKYSDKITENISFGRRSSTVGMFRLYDKYFQVKNKNQLTGEFPLQAMCDNYWYRLEYEVHSNPSRDSDKKYAQQLFNLLADEGISVSTAFNSIAKVFFDIVLNNNRKGSDLNKCVIYDVWSTFLAHNIHFVQFSQPSYVENNYNLQRFKKSCEHFSIILSLYNLLCEYDSSFKEHINTIGLHRLKNSKDNKYADIKQYSWVKSAI